MSLANKIAPILLAPLSDELYTKIQFWWKQGRFPNLKDPQTFNEKLQWLKLQEPTALQVQCADKYAVRDYVADKLGKEYLVPMLGIYRSAEEIDFDALPDRFVLKATHGSGWNLICRDKSKLDISAARAKAAKWLRSNFYRVGRERVYKNISPGVIAEEFLEGPDGMSPPDYKIFCFHGEPQVVEVDSDRHTKHLRTFFGTEWNKLPVKLDYPLHPTAPARPKTLKSMLEAARTLSQPFPFVRVDLYEVQDEKFFGELTFVPAKATKVFEPAGYDLQLGTLLKLETTTAS